MFTRKMLALAGAVAIALGSAQVAAAQTAPVGQQSESDRASGTVNGERVLPGRIGGDRNERQQMRDRRPRGAAGRPAPRRAEAPAAATAEEIRAAAQAQLTATGTTCELTEAINPGMVGEGQVYEAACASGPGYILIGSTPPQVFDCLELAGTAAIARSRDAAADVGQQCALPANQNAVAVIGGYAREAGVNCEVDEAVVIGRAGENLVYEVGCAGADGYRIERLPAGWDVTDCFQVASAGETCRFTTAEEQNATLKTKLAGTEAAGCDIVQARLMGHNSSGRYFEVKCATEGQGYVTRIPTQGAPVVFTCAAAAAQRIGGGCTLTQAAAPVAAPAPTGGRP